MTLKICRQVLHRYYWLSVLNFIPLKCRQWSQLIVKKQFRIIMLITSTCERYALWLLIYLSLGCVTAEVSCVNFIGCGIQVFFFWFNKVTFLIKKYYNLKWK